MGQTTGIEWTDATWNPTRGCSRISPGCKNCYAERQAIRQRNSGYKGLVTITNGHPAWTGEVREAPDSTLYAPLHWKVPRRIFVNSMSDLFHEAMPAWVIERAVAVMCLANWHTYQILTKRAREMAEFFNHPDVWDCVGAHMHDLIEELVDPLNRRSNDLRATAPDLGEPQPHIHLGVSVESPTYLHRVQSLIETPAAVRFVSYEPALEYVDFGHMLSKIDWLIIGGESGPHARLFDIEWARKAIAQCRHYDTAPFVKQLGRHWAMNFGRPLKPHRKGGNMDEWPEDVRVRETPRPRP